MGQLRISGNRFYGIGPDRISAPVSAAHLLPPFDHVDIVDNSIERIGDENQQLSVIAWRAIDIAPEQVGEIGTVGVIRYFADTNYIVATDAAYLLTATRILALPLRRSVVTIRGNQLRGHLTGLPLNRCTMVDSCLFTENHCEVVGEGGKEPIIGDLNARTLNASNNRLIAQGDLQTLFIKPSAEVKRAIVMGNTSTGPIVVINGTPVPDDINLTNIIGF